MTCRERIIKCFFAVLAVSFNVLAFAQPPGGPPPSGTPPAGGSNPPCWTPECIPIDGGVGFLIVAGAALGAKKIYDHRNKSRG